MHIEAPIIKIMETLYEYEKIHPEYKKIFLSYMTEVDTEEQPVKKKTVKTVNKPVNKTVKPKTKPKPKPKPSKPTTGEAIRNLGVPGAANWDEKKEKKKKK